MAYFTTSIAVVAGLCLAFGILFLFFGLRKQSDRAVNILFSLFSLAYAGAILAARAAYMATSLDQYVSASLVSTVFAAAGFSLLVWFVSLYTAIQPRIVLGVVTGTFAAIGLSVIFAPNLVVTVANGVDTMTLPWGESVLMDEQEDALLFPLFTLALFASLVYILFANIQQFRKGDRRKALVLAVGVGWFIFTIVEESLVEFDIIDFVFLSDFGFLGFVVAMGLQIVNSTIESEEELVDYRSNLEEMVGERTDQLREAQLQLVAQAEERATEAERGRLARELHDVVTQLLFSINLVAGSLPRLWRRDPEMAERSTFELQRLTRGALAEMRTLLRELRPHTIANTDLDQLIVHLSDGLSARQDIPATVNVTLDESLPPDVHLAFYRIAQEGMNNIAKHANASTLTVELAGNRSQATLGITDDGYGFDPSDTPTESMGLNIMRERAHEIGADLTVSSEQDLGTTIELIWHGGGDT